MAYFSTLIDNVFFSRVSRLTSRVSLLFLSLIARPSSLLFVTHYPLPVALLVSRCSLVRYPPPIVCPHCSLPVALALVPWSAARCPLPTPLVVNYLGLQLGRSRWYILSRPSHHLQRRGYIPAAVSEARLRAAVPALESVPGYKLGHTALVVLLEHLGRTLAGALPW